MALVLLDASVLIAFLDEADPHHERAVRWFEAPPAPLGMPASVYADVMVGPFRRGPAAVARVKTFVADFGIRIEPITADMAERAAQLRGRRPSLKLPDALVLACGEVLDAEYVLTADRTLAKASARARGI